MFDYRKVEKKLEEFINRMDKIDSLLEYLESKENELQKVVNIINRLDDVDKLLNTMSIIDQQKLLELEKNTLNVSKKIDTMNDTLTKEVPSSLKVLKKDITLVLDDVDMVKKNVTELFNKVTDVKKKQKQVHKQLNKIEDLEVIAIEKLEKIKEFEDEDECMTL